MPPMETRAARRRRERDSVCPICLEPGPDARPYPCDHMCHLQCLLQWATQENSCPVCRTFFNYVMPTDGPAIAIDDAVQIDES